MGFNVLPSSGASSGASGLATRYGVGEVADLSGVPQAYNAGDSFWMQSNNWLARDLLPVAARTLLASAVLSALVAFASPTRDGLANSAGNLSASVPPATLPGITIFQTRAQGNVLLVDSDGPRLVYTGLSGFISVISDGTAFWAFGSGAALTAARSVDGKTWVTQAVSGWPGTYQVRPMLYPFTANSLATSSAQGFRNSPWDTSNQSGVFWAGARYIAVVDDGTNLYVCRSTNGTAWTDDTTQVLGGSVAVAGSHTFFWRSGNTAFLKVGTRYRYTTDGGLNWSNVATQPTALVGGFLQRNGSDPLRLVASLDYTSMFVTTDGGVTWTNRHAGYAFGDYGGGVAYLGSTIIAATAAGGIRKSNDDGATWSGVTFPPAATGRVVRVVADAYRFYIVMNRGQVLTTTDGSTLLVRTGTFPQYVSAAASISSTVTLFVEEYSGSGTATYTIDGGVTYGSGLMRTDAFGTSIGHSTVVGVTAGGISYFVGGTENTNANQRNFVVDVTDLQAGGSLFRSSMATIAANRANTAAFVRVA